MTPYLNPRDLIPQSPIRLFCLPPAGSGTAAFYRWRRLLAPHIDVVPIHLPGREARFATPAHRDFNEAATAVTKALSPHLDRPYALFGHSMGALLAAAIAPRFSPAPRLLIASGREAPHLPFGHRTLHQLPDEPFIQALAQRYGEAAPGLGEASSHPFDDPELRALFLPTLRADIALVESYQHQPAPTLTIPILALAGTEDTSVTPAGLEAWAGLTTAPCTLKRLPGGHFYHTGPSQPALLQLLTEHLRLPT